MYILSILVAVGGAVGSLARFWLAEACMHWFGARFPWGTLMVNVTGCLMIGLFTALSGPDGRLPVGANMRLFVMIGLCGGYTTFSSFSLQTINLLQEGRYVPAVANVLASVSLCLAATAIGFKAGAAFNYWPAALP